MEFLRGLGVALMLPSLGILLWDLCYFWFVKAQIKVYTTKEWLQKFLPGLYGNVHHLLSNLGATGTKIENAPAFAVLFVPGFAIYLLYRVIFLLSGGKPGGYKSRY